VVGYELAAEAQRDLTAEEAAARLRAMPETRAMPVAGPSAGATARAER
jgi:hypothetical protein